MARRLVVVDRDTPLLLPPSIQQWIPQGDIARLIVETVEELEDSQCHFNWRGSGSEQYPPRMMLALLIYCYSHGVCSSRLIEQATYRDVAVRFITADTHPDHDTIATFRRENSDLFKALFLNVLQVAREMKVAQMGTIALDGTILRANASRRQTLRVEQIAEEDRLLEEKIKALEQRAQSLDEAESRAGYSPNLPRELAHAKKRQEALREARRRVKERFVEHQHKQQKQWEARGAESPGSPPQPSRQSEDQRGNVSDPDARMLRQKNGVSAPAYNVQVAVEAQSAAPLIVAASVCDEANDRRQLEPMVEKVMETQPQTTAVVVDSGYDNSAQIYQVERQHGVIVYCPPEENATTRQCGRQSRARQRTTDFREGMRACVRSERGRHNLRLRSVSVEPVIGYIKGTIGFRRFQLRGLRKVNLEWNLVCLGYNFRLLHRLQRRQAAAK